MLLLTPRAAEPHSLRLDSRGLVRTVRRPCDATGSVLGSLKALVSNPTSAVSVIAIAIPQTSRFFMSFILLKVSSD